MLLLLASTASGATLTVGASGTYASINAAEAAASSGDTLAIGPGVYFEVLDPLGKDLTYTSGGGVTISAVDPCLRVDGGETIRIEGLQFDACGNAVVVSGTSSLTATDITFSNNACDDGCALHATGEATVTVRGATFAGNGASGSGGSVYAADDAVISVSDATFSGGAATQLGGEIAFLSDGRLTLTDVALYGGSALYGGAVYLSAGELTGTGLLFSDAVAAQDGGALYLTDAGLTLDGVTFTTNEAAGNGGALFVRGAYGTVRLDAARFVENVAGGEGGGLYATANERLQVASSAFLGNGAGSYGGGLSAYDDEVWVVGTLFSENRAASGGGGASIDASRADVEHVAFACNTAGAYGGGLAVSAFLTGLDAVLVRGSDGGGVWMSAAIREITDTLVWGGSGAAWSGVSDPTGTNGNLAVDPGVRFVTCDGDWTNDDLAPGAGSVLLDAVSGSTDADGSTGDIGAYGGPWGDTLDADGDGVTYWADDCHDGRADAFPGAAEAWYDGVDQDCDGNDDDQDVDGFARADDCDDTAASVNPAVPEAWYDGIDQDCDGNDDDQDVDGAALGDDCDDLDAAIGPDVPEVWYDGVDQDCDGNDADRDVDGYAYLDDCDDEDPDANPGATESWYDGIDQDCDGNDLDQDRDGEGVFTDCDDLDPTAYPGGLEVWYDGVDQDCDGNDDDRDGDGAGGGSGGDDCDDTDATVFVGAVEVWYDGVDQDCDGNDDDQDDDGWPVGVDCDDVDASVFPNATERWYDGVDQDCRDDDDFDQDNDGVASLAEGAGADCDDTNAGVVPGADEVWYDGVDQDCDGNDDDQDNDGAVATDDCDDTDAASFPGAVEVWYDGVDQDCDGRDDDQDNDGAVAAEDCDDTDAAVLRCIARIDGGCDTRGGGGPGGLLGLVGAALLFARRGKGGRRPPGARGASRAAGAFAARGAALLLVAGPAWAIDATGTGRVPTDAGGLQRAGGMAAGRAGSLDVALAAGLAGTTAEAQWDDGTTTPLMAGVATLQLGVGWTFLDGLRVEGGLPLVLGASVPEDLGPGLGDAWLGAQWAVYRSDALSIGPAVELVLPTGDAARLSGGGGVGGALAVAVGGRAGPALWGVELGGGARPTGSYGALAFVPEPELRAGCGARVTVAGPFSVGGELTARVGFGAENAVALATSGAEALLTAGVALERLDVGVAGGVGLLDGVGTPDGRVVLSVRSRLLSAGPRAADADADGVPDTSDRCPDAREDDDGFEDTDGCPDTDDDADGIPDADDRCPSDPEDRDFVQDTDGCPDLDDDADGLADTFDRCPRDPGPADTNGCPDRDRDGLLDGFDQCPDDAAVPGTDLLHSDGCPARVVAFPDRIHLASPLTFDAGRATLRPESQALVGEIAALLTRYPDLARVEIGAHVDEAGDDTGNLKLTVARAEAVKKALVAAGVSPGRLLAQGYGEARPAAPSDTAENRAKNNRVELLLLR